MNTRTVPIRPEEALIEVAVGLSFADAQAQRQAGRPVPPPATGLALLDTGAEVSAIDPELLAPLLAVGVLPQRFVFINLPLAGATPVAEYAVRLVVPAASAGHLGSLTLRNHPVVTHDLAALGYQAILGRDVLENCLLIYDGPGKTTTLCH